MRTAIDFFLAFLMVLFASSSCVADAQDTNKWQELYDPPARIYRANAQIYLHHSAGAPLPGWEVKYAIIQAIRDWKEAGCNIPLEWGGYTTVTPFWEDGLNTVRWEPINYPISAYVVGQAEFDTNKQRWSIVHSEMVLDPNKIGNVEFLRQLILHEIGHVIGLNHSQYNNTVMSGPPFSQYNNLTELTQDDIDGCIALYGEVADR